MVVCWRCGSAEIKPRGFPSRNGKVKRSYDCKSCGHQFTLPVEKYKLRLIKTCCRCNVSLSEENWNPGQRRQGHYICKACLSKRSKAWLDRTNFTTRYSWDERVKAIEHFGGKCSCCGETELKFLVLDHVNNDGAKQRRQLVAKNGWRFYRWLRMNNYPNQFKLQVLCANCNTAKAYFGGCPHHLKTDPLRRYPRD